MIREKFQEHLSLIACVLAIGLVLMFLLFVVQWHLIQQILGYAIELIEAELIQQAPSGVGASEIQQTFLNVQDAVKGIPWSVVSGKISLSKAKTAADYARKSNSDGIWTSQEVSTLLKMTNATVGIKREVRRK